MATKPKYPNSNIIELSEFRDFNEEDILIGSEDEGGEGGEEGKGGRGTGEPMIDPSIFGLTNHLLLEKLRQEERKLGGGYAPVTKEPRDKSHRGGEYIQGPPAHPLITLSQKNDGAPDNDSPDPRQSEEALEKYQELVLANQLRHQATPSATPKLSQGVPRLTK